MVIAIYARKSKLTEQSESVSNQVTLAKEYCDKRFTDAEYLVYDEDEGFSGKNTHRPSFQRMMADLKAKKFTTLCCYRLDRISRSVSDFSTLLDDLQRYNVAFISLREQFDTSTPLGRAMVYIASVFAQLERETLAERVKDNLYELAKTGRWLGGNRPMGFDTVTSTYHYGDRKHKIIVLSAVEDELAQVVDLYQRFIEFGSMSKLVTYCLQQNIKSRNGVDYSRTTLRTILTNPVYCRADEAAWSYFSSGAFNLCANHEDFDGVRGIQPFNRTCKVADQTQVKPTSDWIIAVGQHQGALPGSVWVKAQLILDDNRELGKAYKAPRTESALLSGIIRCAACGSFMRPKAYGKPLPDGYRRFSYICNTKTESRGARCNMPNVPGNNADKLVLKQLAELSAGNVTSQGESPIGYLTGRASQGDVELSIQNNDKKIIEIQRKIDNLMNTLADGVPDAVKQRILKQIEAYDNEIKTIRGIINELNNALLDEHASQDLSAYIMSILSSFDSSFSSLSHDEKRRQIRAVVDQVTWNGKEIKIDILGAKTLPK